MSWGLQLVINTSDTSGKFPDRDLVSWRHVRPVQRSTAIGKDCNSRKFLRLREGGKLALMAHILRAVRRRGLEYRLLTMLHAGGAKVMRCFFWLDILATGIHNASRRQCQKFVARCFIVPFFALAQLASVFTCNLGLLLVLGASGRGLRPRRAPSIWRVTNRVTETDPLPCAVAYCVTNQSLLC